MALRTLGTAATTTLSAIQHTSNGFGDVLPADFAALVALIKNDGTLQTGSAAAPGSAFLQKSGVLQIPGRGFLTMKAGDIIAVDPVTGWPILLSTSAAASASFVHT